MSDVDMFASQENYTNKLENQENGDSDVIPGTPANTVKKKKRRKKKTKWKDKLFVYQENNFEDNITTTNTGTYNKPFVYHDIEEVLKYTLRCFPKNNSIHLIGIHKFSCRKGHFLKQHDGEVSISLDFTVVEIIPDHKEIISVFGSLDFKNSLPVFVVKFFRKEVHIVVNKYVETLLQVRKYIPSDYIEVIDSMKIN